jgi:hypothetical protein
MSAVATVPNMRSKGSNREGMLQHGLSAILTSDLNAFVVFPLHVRKYKRTCGSLFHYRTAGPSVYSPVLRVLKLDEFSVMIGMPHPLMKLHDRDLC